MRQWRDKRVLVTGGDGFIGSHLISALKAQRAEVTSSNIILPDMEGIQALCLEVRPEIVFHLAGLLPASKKSLDEFIAVNVTGTKEVFEASAHSATHFVTLGSALEYGVQTSPIAEDVQGEPTEDYGRSKLQATQFLTSASRSMVTTVLRPATVYGPGQGPGMFIPSCIEACLEHKPFDLSSGNRAIDFLFIDDLIEVLLRAGQRNKGASFEIINVGPGHADTLRSVAQIIATELHAGDSLVHSVPKDSPQDRVLAVTKAAEMLNWHAQTPISQGLKTTILWYKSH